MTQAIKAVFNQTIFPKHIYLGFCRHLCYSKDLTKPSASLQSPDILLQNLRNATNPKNVLRMVNEHYSIMNTKHVLQALRTIFDRQKCGNSEVSTKDLLRHPEFDRLCNKLKFQSGLIELNETLEALKVMSYVGVPSDSTIVQVLLQLLRQNINSLSLPNIMFLEFLLSNFKSSPLVDALKIALPIVFDIQLPVKMDKRNVSHMAEYLYFASKTRVSEDTVNLLVQELYNCEEPLDAKSAKSIIWSLTDMQPRDYFEPLLNKAVNSLVIHVDDLNYSDLETTMSKLIHKYSKKNEFFYQEVLFDICANFVVDQNLGIKHAVYTLRKLARIHHVHKHLLDYLSKQLVEDPLCEKQVDAVDIYSIVISLAITDYRPVHWENLKAVIQRTKNLGTENRKEIIWVRFAASLCVLDIYKIDVLTKALHADYLEYILCRKTGFASDFEHYFAVYQSLKSKRPELVELIPPKYYPENVISNMRTTIEFPLESALQKGLGGESFVKTNLFSKLGARIDHAILFRKGGYPVPINEDVRFIEDIELQPDNQLVLVLALPEILYTLNTKELRGCISYAIKTLEYHGYNVVPVSLESWDALNDFEKIPYLMQAIKNKLHVDSNSISQGM